MKNNHCVPYSLRKFHKLDCIFFRKKNEKSEQNLIPKSKSDTEIFRLIKNAWKRKCLKSKKTIVIKSKSCYKGTLPLFNYRYAICNHNLFLYYNYIDKINGTNYCKIIGDGTKYSKITDDVSGEDTYKLLNSTVRNHCLSFENSRTKLSLKKNINHLSKCVNGKVVSKFKTDKQKMLKSAKPKNFEENYFESSTTPLVNPQTNLMKRTRSITDFHDDSVLLNDKKIGLRRSPISINSNVNKKVSNSINANSSVNDNRLPNKFLAMEDDFSSVLKNSLKTYISDNAAFFENIIRNTCIYESVGELDNEKSKESLIQTHDDNIFMHNDGSNKVYLESLLESAEIKKKLKGSHKHKGINQLEHIQDHEIFISEDIKKHSENKKHTNNKIHKINEFNNLSGIKSNHMCSKKCFSSSTPNHYMKIHKFYESGYKQISNKSKCEKKVVDMGKSGMLCKTRNDEMYFTHMLNKNCSTPIKKKKNSFQNSPTINNFNRFNLIKQMKNMKLLKSFSDSCVDLRKSKFCCIKCRKNNINYPSNYNNHGTNLMETSTNQLNDKDKIAIKNVDFKKFDSILYCNDKKIYYNPVNNRYQLKKIGKSYSNDNIQNQGMLKIFTPGKNLLDKCGDFDIVTKDNNYSKSEMSYIIYSCDGDKYTQEFEPTQVIDDSQCCFADPDLYYCDSELYLSNEPLDSEQGSAILNGKSNLKILELKGSTHSLNEGKEKPNLSEEVYESHDGDVDTLLFRKKYCTVKHSKRKKNVSRKSILNSEYIKQWVHDIKKSESEQSIKSDNGLNQNNLSNSETSVLSDFGLKCNTEPNGSRPRTATITRDVAVSAVCSADELRPTRSTIDKAIMCDEIIKNEQRHIMQLHRNNIIIESSELIQLNGDGTSNYQSTDIELPTTRTPTTEKFLKLELYQGESQTKYLEWHCNQLSNRSNQSSGKPCAELGNINNDQFFGQRDYGQRSKDLDELEFKNNLGYLCDGENHTAQPKNLWSSLKTGSQKVFSFFPPIGPLRTCFKKNIF